MCMHECRFKLYVYVTVCMCKGAVYLIRLQILVFLSDNLEQVYILVIFTFPLVPVVLLLGISEVPYI